MVMTKSTSEKSIVAGIFTYATNNEIDTCGHKKSVVTEMCNMLCDSHHIHNTPGYCYMKLLMARTRAFVELGERPLLTDFLDFAKKNGHYNMLRSEVRIYNDAKVIHVVYGNESQANYDKIFCYKTKVDHPLCESVEITCPRNPFLQNQRGTCPKCRTIPIDMIMSVKDEYKEYRIGFNPEISLKNELDNLVHSGENYYCPALSVKKADDDYTSSFKIERIDNFFTIYLDDEYELELNIDSKEFSHLRHDLVMNNMEESTDVKLEVLNIQGSEKNLTPDYINSQRTIVFELATSLSQSEKSLVTDFNNKKRKYEGILENTNVLFLIAVVSPTHIISNFDLKEEVVNDLCSKVRLGSHLEMKIIDSLGYNPFSKDQSVDYKFVKNIFGSLSEINKSNYSSNHYDVDLMKELAKAEKNEDDDKKFLECIMSSVEKTKLDNSKKIGYSVLKDYLDSFTLMNSRMDDKRICNIPMLIVNNSNECSMYVDVSNEEIPDYLSEIWSYSNINKNRLPTEDEEYKAMINHEEREKFNLKKNSMFKINLNERTEISLAKTGVNAKHLSYNLELKEKEFNDKKGFSPLTNVNDISEFVKEINLLDSFDGTSHDEDLLYLIFKSKELSTFNMPQVSTNWSKNMMKTKLLNFTNLVTILFTEIAYSFKHKTNDSTLLIKRLHNGINIIMKCTGTHTFASFAFPIDNCEIIETGRLGPKLFKTKTHYISDFCSYTDPTIEHFIKAGPYFMSLLSHLYSVYNLPINTINDPTVSKVVNSILLMYLNNKHDCEEIITSQRYFFMKIFETVKESPYIFTERLPSVLRSRLSVYFLNRQIDLMNYYSTNSIVKIPVISSDTEVFYEYKNLKSLFFDGDVTLHQKVNEFYYGYVISKEKSRGSDRTFKTMQKILKEEYDFRDNITNVFTDSFKTKKFQTNTIVLKEFIRLFKEGLSDRCGKEYEDVILSDFIMQSSFSNFSQLSTLKASAKDHSEEFILPEFKFLDNQNKFKSLTKELNPKEFSRRPKAIEAVASLVEEFKFKTNTTEVQHIAQLVPWCLEELENQNGFDSDIFSKSQHGGDREIHVLNVKARVIQYFIELLSKTVCKKFFSETLTHPSTKENFVRDHYKKCSKKFETFHVMSKSADASKWCQRHHVSHFVPMLLACTPKIMHNFILRSLALWTKKKISFSGEMVNILLKNRDLKTDNEIFMRFKTDFLTGGSIFNGKKMSNKIEIQSGMFQGILHYTSSLYHTMIQNSYEKICGIIAEKSGKNILTTVVQGSDDSGMMIGFEGEATVESVNFCRKMLRLKEELSSYLSVYFSVPKSSIGTMDLIEYNSEWHFRKQVIKPTFRWISACMQTNVVEKFVDRIRIFYNVLTQCLEGGATTLECSLVQIAQCWMHYHLLGLSNHPLRRLISRKLGNIPDVKVGFFPFDFDVVAGIPGLDFNNYLMVKYKNVEAPHVADNTMNQFDYDGVDKKLIPHDMQTVKLKFGNLRIWESMLAKLDLGTFEDAIQQIEDDPKILFGRHTTWTEERPMILLKMFSPGVKSSISNHSSMIRMVSAATYLITHPTLTIYKEGETTKTTWYRAILDSEEKFLKNNDEYEEEFRKNGVFSKNLTKDYSRYFPLQTEYEKLWNTIKSFTDAIYHDESYKKSSKIKIQVFEDVTNDFSLIEACKRQWFGIGKLPLSTSQFELFWNKLKDKYKFLKNDFEETKNSLNVTSVEIKNMLESIENKNRSVVFYDSPARGNNLSTILTRVYWPDVKIRVLEENKESSLDDLRSNLFSILTFWMTQKEKDQLVIQLLRDCKLLNEQIGTIPNRFRKLKIMQNYLLGGDKINILKEILNIRQGVLGVFTGRQSGYGSNRTGDGIWNGIIAGQPVVIHLQENNVKLVKVNSVRSLQLLSKRLVTLLEEFKCNFSKNSIRVKGEKVFLDKFGNIHEKHIDDDVQLISIEPSLKVKIIEDIEDSIWKIETNNTTIRLIANIKISEEESKKMTILSETLSNRDWFQNCPNDFTDKNLSKWSKGESCDIVEFQKSINKNIPNTKSLFERFVNSQERKTFNGGLYDLNSFISTIQSVFAPELFKVHKNIVIEEEELMAEDDKIKSSKEAQRILREYAPLDTVTTQFVDWAEEVSTKINEPVLETSDGRVKGNSKMKILNNEDLNEEEEAELKQQLDIFNEVNFKEFDYDDIDWKWNEMPKYNKFFSSIECFCFALYSKKVRDLCVSGDVSDSFLGKLVSLITGKYLISKQVNTTQIELFNSVMTDTMSDPDNSNVKLKYSDLSEEELKTKYDECFKNMKDISESNLNDNVKHSLIKTLEDESLKIEKTIRFNEFYNKLTTYSQTVIRDLEEFLKTICKLKKVSEMHKLCNSLTGDVKLQYIKQGIISKINSLCSDGVITMSYAQNLIYDLRTENVTMELVECLISIYEFNIQSLNYNSPKVFEETIVETDEGISIEISDDY